MGLLPGTLQDCLLLARALNIGRASSSVSATSKVSYLTSEDASTSGGSDSSLGLGAEEFSSDNDWHLWKSASAEDLRETELGHVDDWSLGLVLGVFGLSSLGQEWPKLVDVDGLAPLSVEVSSEDSDTLLSEMSRVASVSSVVLQFEDVGSLMSETSSLTTTSWMLPVFADSTVTV